MKTSLKRKSEKVDKMYEIVKKNYPHLYADLGQQYGRHLLEQLR